MAEGDAVRVPPNQGWSLYRNGHFRWGVAVSCCIDECFDFFAIGMAHASHRAERRAHLVWAHHGMSRPK